MKLYITGGGTGGHVTPGIAIARYFLMKRPDTEVRFAGTARGIESKLIPREGFQLDTFEIAGLKRSFSPKAIASNVGALRMAMSSISKAKAALRKFAPDCVIGCGGYASFPAVMAAQKLGIPTVLLEVNAFPGVVTKAMCKKASCVMVCFEEAKKLLGGGDNIVVTGSPVRTEIVFADRQKAREKLGLKDDERLLVSFWGSMGAQHMNEKTAEMLACETAAGNPFRHVHATGAAAWKWLPDMAERSGAALAEHPEIELTEYIYDMADRMAAADLVVCRAGAATIGELCALGKPSIMVPSPYVAENHQEKNARALEAAGACEVLLEQEADGKTLYERAAKLICDEEKLADMSASAAKLAKLDAGENIYQVILKACGK